MQTTITQHGPAEYELEIMVPSGDLAPELNKAIRAQRSRMNMKGFRPGKVPLSLVKKMVGEDLAHAIADERIQQIYEDEVLADGAYDVLGQPTITQYDYELDGDLHAVVRFGVRPEVALKDLSNEEVTALTYTITDEEVDEELENLRQHHADLVPVKDEPVGPEDLVTFDLQELDEATQTPIIGKRDEDQSLFLNDPRLDDSPLLRALADALEGRQAGDHFRFRFEHDEAHGLHAGHHVHFFEATIKDVQRRDVPDLDDAFAQDVTNGKVEDVEGLRAEIRNELESSWDQTARQFLEGNIVEKLRELHPVPVPDSVIELFLDAFVKDVKERNDGELPPNFDEAAFRAANREEAVAQGRWMLIRDQIVENEGLAVTDEDLNAFFEEQSARDERLSVKQLHRFYEAMEMMDNIEQRLLSRKVFDWLKEQFQIVEKDREVLKQEIEERQAEAAAASATTPGAAPAPTDIAAQMPPETEEPADGAEESA